MPSSTAAAPVRMSWGKWAFYRLIGKSTRPTTDPHDPIREGLETIVFVVVLVFMLKQFVVEAYVIPTGSMAETLYGDHKNLTCPECGFAFTINSHAEVQDDAPQRRLAGYCCPNCRHRQGLTGVSTPPYTPSWTDRVFGQGNSSGDRVLVLKAIYHREKAVPGDIVVFKFPEEPQIRYGAQNYIKRMWATGGQTLAIWCGDLYVCDSLTYPAEEPQTDLNDLWKLEYAHHNAASAQKLFEESRRAGFPRDGQGFKPIRKSDVILDEMKRIVYDNDFQAAALTQKGVPPRWKPETGDWTADAANKTFTHAGPGLGWLRYRHLLVDDWKSLAPGGRPIVPPSLIENFLGYNAECALDSAGQYRYVLDGITEDSRYWVGDLIVETEATITDANAELTLELSKGPNRFQAIFKGGAVTLRRTGAEGKDASGPTGIGTGTYRLRFANVDGRLRVHVNGQAVAFNGDVDYAPRLPDDFDKDDVKREGWVRKNDLEEPVGIGAAGGVAVAKLKIWRDTYFIHFNNPYRSIQNVTDMVDTYYARPGHYLCLGDNSAQSSDSRKWGSVPDRLLLGKACAIFFPIDRIGVIK